MNHPSSLRFHFLPAELFFLHDILHIYVFVDGLLEYLLLLPLPLGEFGLVLQLVVNGVGGREEVEEEIVIFTMRVLAFASDPEVSAQYSILAFDYLLLLLYLGSGRLRECLNEMGLSKGRIVVPWLLWLLLHHRQNQQSI
jgi:hypothetical protein